MKNQRIIVFFIFIGLFTASYYIGSLSEISKEDAELFMEEFEELIEDIDGLGIFLHNSMIALLMFVPGAGVGWGLFSAFQTGQAFAAIALLVPEIAEIHPLTILFASPFVLVLPGGIPVRHKVVLISPEDGVEQFQDVLAVVHFKQQLRPVNPLTSWFGCPHGRIR